MTPEEILYAAADDMATHGHCKGSFFDAGAGDAWRTSPSCAYGAMARATGNVSLAGTVNAEALDRMNEVAERLARAITSVHPLDVVGDDNPYNIITTYNDHKSVTAEDMILRFKEAAHDTR